MTEKDLLQARMKYSGCIFGVYQKLDGIKAAQILSIRGVAKEFKGVTIGIDWDAAKFACDFLGFTDRWPQIQDELKKIEKANIELQSVLLENAR